MKRKQRRLGRELALLWLFQIDMGKLPMDEVIAEIPDELTGVEEEALTFALQLIHGYHADTERIDRAIVRYAKGWPLKRMAAIDRNVLRIALCEIYNMPDIPASVSVDEAVEVAKHYSTEESGKFVNGILGAFLRGEEGVADQ